MKTLLEAEVTLYAVIFYVLAIIVLVSTLLAITRRQVVHAVVYLIISFITTALLFYLLGAPFLAVLEVIIYAGAIMVLFLFIVMTVRVESIEGPKGETLRRWLPAVVLSVISFAVGGVLIFEAPGSRVGLNAGMATPTAFGHFIFKSYWFPVEIASFLLLIGLVGALYLGRQESKTEGKRLEDKP
jgi:NADH-quinone oxidoreductase subunit J